MFLGYVGIFLWTPRKFDEDSLYPWSPRYQRTPPGCPRPQGELFRDVCVCVFILCPKTKQQKPHIYVTKTVFWVIIEVCSFFRIISPNLIILDWIGGFFAWYSEKKRAVTCWQTFEVLRLPSPQQKTKTRGSRGETFPYHPCMAYLPTFGCFYW